MIDLFPALDSTAELLGAGLVVALVYVLPIWAWSVKKEDVSIIDPFWGLGFVVLAWFWAVSLGEAGPRQLLILVMVTLWGLRLSIYLGWRKRGAPEDRRYQEMRKAHPDTFPVRSLFTVFLLQGFLIWAIGTPLLAAQRGPGSGLTWLDAAGVLLWLTGLFFEAVGDWQLARFKARRSGSGEVLSSGLWRYTRHPNYFGDFLVWWGHFLVAAAAGGWWTIYAPLAMSVLLMRFSGVGPLEKDLKSTKPKYEDYVRRTNAFFPGPPGD
jgi:steroid 5-alpha reductase family enzyme